MKTKIVIFQKKCKKSTTLKPQFYINNENIEITNSYTYLGVKFSTNGSFKELEAILEDKAKRAIFATRQHLNFLRLPIDISNRLKKLNSLYLPILMYGSKVWSIYDKDDYNSWVNDSTRGGTGYAGSLRGNSINFRGNTLTPVTSYISLRKNDVIVYF